MKIRCDKSDLFEALNIVSKAVAQKSSIPIQEGIHINVTDTNLILTANDSELAIESIIEASVFEKGDIVINAKTLIDIVRNLPLGEIEIETNQQNSATIKGQHVEYKIMGLSGDEFPAIPVVSQKGQFLIPSAVLKSMIKQTLFAVSVNESKQNLTGALFEVNQNEIKAVALDGFRMAIRTEILEKEYEPFSFIIPGRTLNELIKILKDYDALVDVSLTDRYLMLEMENSKIVSRLLEGEFINYKKIIPTEKKITTKISLNELIESVERCSPIIANDTTKSPVKLIIDNDKLTVSCITNMGQIMDEMAIEDCENTLEIGFNQKYLLDALKVCQEEKIVLEMNTALSPCLIKPVEGDKFIYIVLPVRLRND